MIRTQMRVSQRRGIGFVPSKLLDLEQWHSRGDQVRAVRVAQIVIAKRRPQTRFLDIGANSHGARLAVSGQEFGDCRSPRSISIETFK